MALLVLALPFVWPLSILFLALLIWSLIVWGPALLRLMFLSGWASVAVDGALAGLVLYLASLD